MKKNHYKCNLLLLIVMLMGCAWTTFAQVPVITSFSPVSAKPGDVVILTGSNFNITPNNNIVFFGATRASVTAATATSVTVTVPSGATYAPITLLNTGVSLAASSLRNFTPTYSPAKTAINAKNFQAKQDFATGRNPYSVALGDLDGDGKPDLAVANSGSNTVSVYRNMSSNGSIGAGSFAIPIDFTTGTRPRSIAIGDLDGDGKLDLAVTNQGSGTVSVFRNMATSGSIVAGSFAAKVDFTTGSFPQSVAIGDLDGDGKPDMAVVVQGMVSVFRNTATSGSIVAGSFEAKVDFATGSSGSGSYSVALGDLDGDGMPELAVANFSSNTVSVLRNADIIPLPTITSFSPMSAKPGDAVILTGTNFNTTSSNNIVFFGVTRAIVSAATAISVMVTVPSGATYAPITLLNTGVSLAASSLRNFTPTYNPAKTAITATDFQAKQDFASGAQPFSVAVGDLDGDGKLDLAVANEGSYAVSVYRNTSSNGSVGAGSFAIPIDFTTGTQPRSVAIGDLDGDGKLDLAVANQASGTVSIFRNMATSGSIVPSSFADKIDFATGSGPRSVAIGDLDGDGKPDLAVANSGSKTVSVFRNTSSRDSIDIGSFDAKVDFTTGVQPYSVAMGDLDGDGKPELATANFSSNNISVFRNTSSSGNIFLNSFATKVDFTTGAQPYSIALGDLDGDGRPELAVANYVSSTVSVYHNMSSSGSIVKGSFAAQVDFATGKGPRSVAMGDLDGDGKTDLVVTNQYSDMVSVIRNTATSGSIVKGSFADKVDFTTGTQPASVALGDLDGDGKPELAVANYGSFTVSVLRNANANADLSALTLSAGSLSPAFAAANTAYNANVTNATNSITVTPTLADASASVKINGITVVSGAVSGALALNEGSNTITVVVTAQNALTKTYIITIFRTFLPIFTAIAPICSGATLAALPTTSNNNIQGTWSPVLDNTLTTTYTFTPNVGQDATSTTITVTVNANPNATASSSTPVICAGNTLNLTSSGGSTYAWMGTNAFASTNQNPTVPNATISNSGTYKVTVTNINGCTSTATTSITVNPANTATVTLSPTTICAGTSGSITPTVTNGGSNYSYVWKINQVIQTTTSPNINYSTAVGNDEYSLTVTPSPDACPISAFVTASVKITPLTVPKVYISPAIVCENTDRTLGFLPSINLGTTPSYVWKRNNATLATSSTISVTNTVLRDTYAVTVTLSPDAGCYTTYTATSSLIVGCILSIISGNWEDPTTWNLNRTPLTTDNAVINNNHNVTITTDSANSNKAEVRPNAKLIYGNSAAKLKLGKIQ